VPFVRPRPRPRAQWMEINGFITVNWKNVQSFVTTQSKMLARARACARA
jgi:hypothetical protein